MKVELSTSASRCFAVYWSLGHRSKLIIVILYEIELIFGRAYQPRQINVAFLFEMLITFMTHHRHLWTRELDHWHFFLSLLDLCMTAKIVNSSICKSQLCTCLFLFNYWFCCSRLCSYADFYRLDIKSH